MRMLRQAFGLSQERLARLVGVSVRTVARWEGGQSQPSPLAERQLRGLENLERQLSRLMRPESVGEWMTRPNVKLGGRSPRQVLLSDGPEPILRQLQDVPTARGETR
ncbi:helix-turn-helix domain-containing protein [Candidatus Zixiibacteriota bacterium]